MPLIKRPTVSGNRFQWPRDRRERNSFKTDAGRTNYSIGFINFLEFSVEIVVALTNTI